MTGPPLAVGQYAGSTASLDARMALHARFSAAAYDWHQWVFDRLELRPGAAVVEVGAGTGQLWSANGPRRPAATTLWLLDSSPAMCRHLAGLHLPAAAVVRADAQRLPLRDAVADVVVANHMLYHVPDRAAAIHELHRVLRPSGRAVVATNGRDHMRELDELYAVAGADTRVAPMHDAFPLEAAAGRLGTAFADVQLHVFDDGLRVTEVEPLVAYLHSVEPLTPPQLDRLRAHLEHRIAADGVVEITKSVGLVVGRPGR